MSEAAEVGKGRRPLTDRQMRFVEAYTGEAALNRAKAARIAGYAEARSDIEGTELMRNPVIRGLIDKRLAEQSLSSMEVLERLSQIARNAAADYIHEEGYVDLARMKADGKIHLVKGIKDTKYGKEIELFDPQAALGTLAKHHGLLRDQIEITTLGRVSKEMDEMSDAELCALAERIAGIGVSAAADSGEAEG